MKNLSSKVINNAYRVLEGYKEKNENRNYHLNSLISYFIESEIRNSLKEESLKDNEIDTLFQAMDLNVNFKINNGSVKFNVNYR